MKDSSDSAKSASQTPEDRAIGIAREYITKKKGWSDEEFHLEVIRTEGTHDAPVVVLDAVNKEDLKGHKGGGKSLQLHVDVKTGSVTKELGYQ